MQKSDTFLYQEIAESIRRRIASGELESGDKLAPVREMAERWGCTPGTVSRAYSQLAQEGLIEGHRGGGTRVTANELQPDRPVWGWATLVNRAERFLLEALGTGYTPSQVESALAIAVARWQELQRQSVSPSGSQSSTESTQLHFVGSHDLTVELLTRMLSQEDPGIHLSVEYVGSLGGLMALAQEEAQVAGIHLWDEITDRYNIPFIRRLLPGRSVATLTLAHRSLGLITPPGNPQELQSLADLTHSDVRLVNRQSGSGTRVWLDTHLKRLDIPPESVAGYRREELTHLATAQAVAQGEATVGLGIHAAAAAYGLHFVSLTRERYELVFLKDTWHSPAAQTLINIVRSHHFQQAVDDLGGYDTTETGQERWVS
jgi:putative molybdopterin biosynthesis protein